VSEPTPTAVFSGGEDWTVTLIVVVVVTPPVVTLAVIVFVPGRVQIPSISMVQLLVPPLPAVTDLGCPVTVHVQAALELGAFTVKPEGMPATTVFVRVARVRAVGVDGCAWAVAVRPREPKAAAVAAATMNLRMVRALSYQGLVGRAVGTYFGERRRAMPCG
jgi:hypothetical protein